MSLPPDELCTYRFGSFELDTARRELRREGRKVAIAPKPLALLTLLIERRDFVVSRAEALAAVWPDVQVSQATLASTLRDLRRALAEEAQTPAIVETARGLGFRFIAPVEQRASRTYTGTLDEAPLVGRDATLEKLEDALAGAAGGQGAVLMLEGEPGIGKTRLLASLAASARTTGAIVCQARFPESSPGPAYRPWGELLATLLASQPAGRLAEELGGRRSWLARLVPSLSAEPEPAPAPDPDDEGATLRLFDAVAWLVRRVAAAAPLVFVLDDLHGADRSSLRLLEFLADLVRDARILIACAYRSCELNPEHPLPSSLAELARLPGYRRLRLEGVDPESTRRLVEVVLGHDPGSDRIVEIHERTDGNPFYVLELARFLAEHAQTAAERSVPPALCELLRGRLQRLPWRSRDTLELASVIGREFPLDLLRRATGLGSADLAEALEAGQRAGLVEFGWSGTRRFQHALVCEAIYGGLLGARRRLLHQRVGKACRALATAERGEFLALAAHHLCEVAEDAGDLAIEAATSAAMQAETRLAFAEAVRLHRLGLDALDRVAPDDHERRAGALLALARAQLRAGQLWLAIDTARRAAALAGAIRRPDLSLEAALLFGDYLLVDSAEQRVVLEEALAALGPEHEALRGRGLAALANALWYEGQQPRRIALADRALAIARTVGMPRDVVLALLARHSALGGPEGLQQRLLLADQALREADRLGHAALRCLVLSYRSIDLLESGDRSAAERDVAQLEEIARAHHQIRYFDHAPRWRALFATLEGRFSDAEVQIAESVRLRPRSNLPTGESYAAIQLGMLLREQGRMEELAAVVFRAGWFDALQRRSPAAHASWALVELESGRPGAARRLLAELVADEFAILGGNPESLFAASSVAVICRRLEEREVAAAVLERVEPFADQVACLYGFACRGSFARYCGTLAVTIGLLDQAEAWYETGLAMNRAIGASLYEAWTLWDLARLLRERGDLERARACAEESHALAVQRGLHRLRERIEAEADGFPLATVTRGARA